jgi:hypothetical protein
MVEQLLAGADTEQVLEAIYKAFPQASSTAKDVSWYRWKLRKEGKLAAATKLTVAERKERKAEYEREYRAKQVAKRQERKEAAIKERVQEILANIPGKLTKEQQEAITQQVAEQLS